MNRSSNARTLRIAVATSIAVHLVIASVVHSSEVTAAPEAKSMRVIVVKLPKPTPPPPPKLENPKPQHARRAVHPAIHIVRQHSKNNPNTHVSQAVPNPEPTGDPIPISQPGTPGPASTGAPSTATPTPKPACSAPDIPAKAVDAISPQAPPDAQNANATAKIKVDLDANGNVIDTSVYESTGSMPLDHAALAAARESRYTPEEKNCKNVAGSYLFTVDFQQ